MPLHWINIYVNFLHENGAKILKRKATINVTGIVQGVGFRPFVYRTARSLSLFGYVLNLGDAGVKIVVEGEEEDILKLVNKIKHDSPSISRIDTLDIVWQKTKNAFRSFEISKSSMNRNDEAIPVIPPDIAICGNCINDLTSSLSRWYLYPFTSCAACGPRFSTITDLPYDRPNTTMVDFPLCNTCNIGYTNPLDRRYHAQTTACQDCGPMYRLLDKQGHSINSHEPIREVARLISEDEIIAIQGISGTHIATKTSDPKPIEVLRKRKRRSQRPFAIMVRDFDTLQKIVHTNTIIEKLVTSWRRPIVLVPKRDDESDVLQIIPKESCDLIAPELDTIGVMLPYAAIHHLLFDYTDEPALVLTSANPTGMPMYIETRTIISELTDIVDYFLVHNRRIHQRADDSVVKLIDEENPIFIRRARGYVPEPIPFNGPWKSSKLLGVGPEEKATGSILKTGQIYMTQYIGDTNHVENIEFLSDAINHMQHLLGVSKLDAIACDLHPEFLSTELAEKLALEQNIPLFRVQHHHAHLAAIMVDGLLPYDNRIVCITADGYGYGEDGSAWGGDILVGDLKRFERRGGLKAQEYTGGDLSAIYAARSFIGIVSDELERVKTINILKSANISQETPLSEELLEVLIKATRKKINTIKSTSVGRFLDAVAVALGVCSENSYDAECPMKLESIARPTDIELESYFIKSDYGTVLDTTQFLVQIVDLMYKGVKRSDLAFAAQWYLGQGLAEIACDVADSEGILHVGFSGGVALNRIITKAIDKKVRENALVPIFHSLIPPGDGGVSVGQVASTAARLTDY
ncbi:carbamoyltransferase HypF [Candidatus Thorarchaeota archaeon]|nr:MAG: carbamoyltransferase HypF [Candidatus Thorarchaeota archaeon]